MESPAVEDAPAETPPRVHAASLARRRQFEHRLLQVEQMFALRVPQARMVEELTGGTKLGWTVCERQAYRLIREVRRRWKDRQSTFDLVVAREQLRDNYAEVFRKALAAEQYGAANTSLRAIGELDGLFSGPPGETHQHLHVNAPASQTLVAEAVSALLTALDKAEQRKAEADAAKAQGQPGLPPHLTVVAPAAG